MQFGSFYVETENEMVQVQHLQKWKRMLAPGDTTTKIDFEHSAHEEIESKWLKFKQELFQRLLPIGILIGASCAAYFMRYSRRNVFMCLNVSGIIACLISSIDNFYMIIFGRFLYGAVGGVMLSVTPKML